MDGLEWQDCLHLIRQALAEDIGAGDVTTEAVVPKTISLHASMVARESLVVSGCLLAEAVFRELSREVKVTRRVKDGERVAKHGVMMDCSGPAHPILAGERVALNFLQRLSGIATWTARFVEAVRGTPVQILDTRKTVPGWRQMEKYAVRCGGGKNHRMGLFDMILIKDNHWAALGRPGRESVRRAVWKARTRFPGLRVEVETDTVEEVDHALEAGADVVLLDNMSLEELRRAVARVNGRTKTEASGGVSLATVRRIAETGVDFISVGALTHSAPSVDVAFEVTLNRG